MLFAFPVLFYVSQTAQGGDGNEYSASVDLVAEDNSIVGGDIAQVSAIDFGTPASEDNSGGGSNGGNEGGEGDGNNGGGDNGGSDEGNGGGSGGNDNGGDNGGSGGSSDNGGSGGNNGGNGGSGGNPQDNSGGDSGGESGGSEIGTAGPTSINSSALILINEIHPDMDSSGKYANGKVELYNPGDSPVNLNQWYLQKFTGFTIGTINKQEIAPHGFLVVDVTGLTGNYQEITLFDSSANKKDSVTYSGAKSHIGSCYARIPDGADNWKWMTCTLGSPNRQETPS